MGTSWLGKTSSPRVRKRRSASARQSRRNALIRDLFVDQLLVPEVKCRDVNRQEAVSIDEIGERR